MQWDDTENAGFTTGTPWLKVNPNYKQINAASQVHDEDSVFSYYKKLISLRKQYPIIIDGHYELLLPEDDKIFAYTRTLGKEKLLVICNFSEETLDCPLGLPEHGELLIANYETQEDGVLKPYEAIAVLTTEE